MIRSLFFIPEVRIQPLFGLSINPGRGFISLDQGDHFFAGLFSACFNDGYIFQVLKDFNDIFSVKFLNQLLKSDLTGPVCFLGLHKFHELFRHCIQVGNKRFSDDFGQSDVAFSRVNLGEDQQVRINCQIRFFSFGHV